MLHYPTEGAASDAAGVAAPGPEVPVVCLRRDEGAALLGGSVDALTLRFVEPAAFYRRVIDDCAAARNLAGGTHAYAHTQPPLLLAMSRPFLDRLLVIPARRSFGSPRLSKRSGGWRLPTPSTPRPRRRRTPACGRRPGAG